MPPRYNVLLHKANEERRRGADCVLWMRKMPVLSIFKLIVTLFRTITELRKLMLLRIQCLSDPLSCPNACNSTLFLIKISKFSFTALGFPGKFTIIVLPFIPIIPLERQAVGTILIASWIMNWVSDSAFLSKIWVVASGVTSLSANPVPPDVRIRSTYPHWERRTDLIWSTSSEMIC